MRDDHTEPAAADFEKPSKSQRKREALALQDMGEMLVTLKPAQLDKIPLPEELHEAVLAARQMNQRGARKRQLQYIGRLMRDVDAAPIIAKLEVWNGTSKQHITWLHQVENWRDRLLAEPDALTELLAAYPQSDAQRLRALIRNALKEKELQKPPKCFREIFQVLREIIPEAQ